jgi:hypothetical protein
VQRFRQKSRQVIRCVASAPRRPPLTSVSVTTGFEATSVSTGAAEPLQRPPAAITSSTGTNPRSMF